MCNCVVYAWCENLYRLFFLCVCLSARSLLYPLQRDLEEGRSMGVNRWLVSQSAGQSQEFVEQTFSLFFFFEINCNEI